MKHLLCLYSFKQNWNAPRNFSEYPKHEVSPKYGHWELLWLSVDKQTNAANNCILQFFHKQA